MRRPRRGSGRVVSGKKFNLIRALRPRGSPWRGECGASKGGSAGCIGARIFALEVVAGSNPVKCCGAAYPAVGAFNSG
jgi:hypothetical protein